MGVHCEINLFKPSDGAYQPGSTVSGIIKYAVDEPTVFDKITVSLKGHGLVVITEENANNGAGITYTKKEVYVDIDNVSDNEQKIPHGIGMYETRFDYKLPDNIPSSLRYRGRKVTHRVKCKVMYYIRIKFENSGFLQFAKRFKKELIVISKMKPTLPREPHIYGEQKSLFQLFSMKKSIVNIKATIKDSVIPIGGNIELKYEVTNDTNLTIKGVEIKLVENHTFTAGKKVVNLFKDVDSTDSKTGTIKGEEKENIDIVINVPSDVTSMIGYSKIVSRNYLVRIIIDLPFPHINAVLQIPVEIGELAEEIDVGKGASKDGEIGKGDPDFENPPPSYWEAMGEMTKDEEYSCGKSGMF